MIDTLCVIISLAAFALGVWCTIGIFIAYRSLFFPTIRDEEITSALSFFRQTREMMALKYDITDNLYNWVYYWTHRNRLKIYSADGWDTSVVLKYQMIPIDEALCDVCNTVRLCVTCTTTPEFIDLCVTCNTTPDIIAVCSKCVKKVPKLMRCC